MQTTPLSKLSQTSPSNPSRLSYLPFAPWPHFEADEIEAALAPLKTGRVNYWTGDEGRKFESEYAAHLGVEYAVALTNGTVALELALVALGVGPGDEVVTSSRTFIASASAAVMRGAVPVLADVDAESQVMTAETIRAVLTPRTKAVIVVHLAGWPCEMDAIMALAKEHDLKVIEDCAQAHGATYRGKPVGTFGDVAAFSFCQDKIITTGGEGGLLATNDAALWARAWAFKDHGKSFEAVYHREHPPGFRWLHESFGTNWRMLEMQAAIGRVALSKLPGWSERRRRHAALLAEGFAQIDGLRVTVPPAHVEHAYYKYYAFLEPSHLREDWTRDRVMEAVNDAGIPCFSGSCSEIYLEGAFQRAGLGPKERLPVAKRLGETSLMFLVHPTLRDGHMYDTCDAVGKVMAAARR